MLVLQYNNRSTLLINVRDCNEEETKQRFLLGPVQINLEKKKTSNNPNLDESILPVTLDYQYITS